MLLFFVFVQHPVLLTEAPLNPRKNRVKAAEVLFYIHLCKRSSLILIVLFSDFFWDVQCSSIVYFYTSCAQSVSLCLFIMYDLFLQFLNILKVYCFLWYNSHCTCVYLSHIDMPLDVQLVLSLILVMESLMLSRFIKVSLSLIQSWGLI